MGTKKSSQTFITPTAIINKTARIGAGTKVWAFSQVAEHASIGTDCIIGNGVYIDRFVKIGNRVWIHNKALLYQGVVVEDDVFIGPGVCFTNDPWPRSGARRPMNGRTWTIHKGASVGANSTIMPDISIGFYAIVGAGSLVSSNVPDQALVYGNPARLKGLICRCGFVLRKIPFASAKKSVSCESCGKSLPIPKEKV